MPYRVYQQKVSFNGHTLWEEALMLFEGEDPYIRDLKLDKSNDKIITTWGYGSNSSGVNNNLYVQINSSDCEIMLDPNGYQITTLNTFSLESEIASSETGLFISWLDRRLPTNIPDGPSFGTNSIFMQKLDLSILEYNETDVSEINVSLSNYPNPFNPSTEIRFQISDFRDQKSAEIEIYNIKGQRVREFKVENVKLQSGSDGREMNKIIWNGTDQNNHPVASGIYYYTLKLDGKVEASRKMVLLK